MTLTIPKWAAVGLALLLGAIIGAGAIVLADSGAEGEATDDDDLALLHDAQSSYRAASDAAVQQATSCEREVNRLGEDYRKHCLVPVVEPLFEEAEGNLADALEVVQDRVGPDCEEALARAILEVEAGDALEEPDRAVHACEADAASSGAS